MNKGRKDELKIKLIDLKIKTSYVNDFDEDLNISLPDDVKYSIESGIGVDRESQTIISQVIVAAFYQKNKTAKKHDLYGITTETYFLVDNIKDLFDGDEMKLPRDLATKILNIGIGSTRGLLKGLLQGNPNYAKCTLPLIAVPVQLGEELDV